MTILYIHSSFSPTQNQSLFAIIWAKSKTFCWLRWWKHLSVWVFAPCGSSLTSGFGRTHLWCCPRSRAELCCSCSPRTASAQRALIQPADRLALQEPNIFEASKSARLSEATPRVWKPTGNTERSRTVSQGKEQSHKWLSLAEVRESWSPWFLLSFGYLSPRNVRHDVFIQNRKNVLHLNCKKNKW